MRYPRVDKTTFYREIDKTFKQYKIPKTKATIDQYCFPSKFQLQIPQKLLAEYINPKTPYRGLLVYHGIGSGKTCTAISISLGFVRKNKVMVILPASLIGGFRAELRSPCAGNRYISDADRKLLTTLDPNSTEYRSIIAESNLRIDEDYDIYSYNKFSLMLKNKHKFDLQNTLMIIDEVHNMISDTGTYYSQIYKLVQSAPDSFRLVIMTATPIFDKPSEIALTLNLLRRDIQLPTGSEFRQEFIITRWLDEGPTFEATNLDVIRSFAKGYVSYYRGAPPFTFPKQNLQYVDVLMSPKQLALYNTVMKRERSNVYTKDFAEGVIPKNFFIGVRMISNIVYPNNDVRSRGFSSMTPKDYQLDKMKILSPKFVEIVSRIKADKGTAFVYSNFKGYNGVQGLVEYLKSQGYQDYLIADKGPKRFAIWSGDQAQADRDRIRAVFNNPVNIDGSYIKLILGSPSIKEGVTLLRVSQVHLLDPYWNWSRMKQIIGRAIRFCSHKDVPANKRKVDVFIYLAVHPKLKVSIDQYIMRMANTKRSLNETFEMVLKEAAIDCNLLANANEDDIVCMGS